MTVEERQRLEEEILSAKGQWFVINCNTGHEEKVMMDLQQKIRSSHLENEVFAIRISKHLVPKKDKEVEKNKFPGYIFINMNMTQHAWFVVRNTPGVTGFIGSSGRGAKPFPLTDDEVLDMLMPAPEVVEAEVVEAGADDATKAKGQAVPKKQLKTANFAIDEVVLIKDGPYANEEGKVLDMDYSKGVAIVQIEMFGRYTPAEVSFENVQPIKEY